MFAGLLPRSNSFPAVLGEWGLFDVGVIFFSKGSGAAGVGFFSGVHWGFFCRVFKIFCFKFPFLFFFF